MKGFSFLSLAGIRFPGTTTTNAIDGSGENPGHQAEDIVIVDVMGL